MAKLADYPVLNFSGGIRRDKSMFEMQKNELLDARNCEIDEQGRIRIRRGSEQIGDTVSGNIENSFMFVRMSAGAPSPSAFLCNTDATSTVIRRLNTIRLTAAAAVGATSLTTTGTGDMAAASASASINGDLFTYTAVGANSLTVTAGHIQFAHPVGSTICQWETRSQASTMDGRSGITYAVLGNVCYMVARNAVWQKINNNDAETLSNMSSTPPAGLLVRNYRDRLYVVGDGSAGTNGDPRRVSFSGAGNGDSWTTGTDYFDVEDQRGEYLTGSIVLNDVIWLTKYNSFFSYNEVELKPRQSYVGAWNHKVAQEINGLIYTFCPSGIFATNGLESVDIGKPVREFWRNFTPQFDAAFGRVITNTFSWKYDNRYFLYIQDITVPTSTNDIVLEYDTAGKRWTIHDTGFTNFFHANYYPIHPGGISAPSGSIPLELSFNPNFIGGNDSGQMFSFFHNYYRDATPANRGGDILFENSGNTRNPVQGYFETPLYDMTRPDYYKQFNKVRFFVEQGQWNIEYRTHKENGISEYKQLGMVARDNAVLSFPLEANGWRVGFRISSNTAGSIPVFNGFVIKETEVSKRA